MPLMTIVEAPDSRLRQISKPVETVTDELRALIADMFETMYDAPGIGLAAIQVGHPLRLAQTNQSVSRAGTIRGVHFADVPPGQAKYIYCPRGAVLDVVVDVRVGSPAFGEWELVCFDAREDSPTRGLVSKAILSEHRRCLINVPTGVWHANRNIGSRDVVIVNFPTTPYDHAAPDKERLPLDTPLIPYSFKDPSGW